MYNRKLTNIAKNLVEVELKYYELRRLPIIKEYNQIVSLRKDVRKNTSSYMEANKIFSYSMHRNMVDLTLTFQNGYPIPDHFKLKVDYKKGVK